MDRRITCRNYYKELRDAMSQDAVRVKSAAICDRILNSEEYKSAQTIFAYYPLGKEVDCLKVLKCALSDGKQVALPRTSRQGQMDFYKINTFHDVEEGNFHVMEPKEHCEKILPIVENDKGKDGVVLSDQRILVLVPGVVFDRDGNRYGYGKGYYDRYFARFLHTMRIALAYSEQVSEQALECLGTDIKMHAIVTEEERISVE